MKQRTSLARRLKIWFFAHRGEVYSTKTGASISYTTLGHAALDGTGRGQVMGKGSFGH